MTILDSQLANRVWETTLTTGTGPVTLAGARTGFRRFEDAIDDGPTPYFIASASLAAWEVGLGTFTAPNALSRDTVLTSSNGGALVNFIAGSKDVVLDVPSELLDALVAADATEAAARIAAVLAEATARSNADSAESTARGNADTALQDNIDDEEAARIAGDVTLQAEIDALGSSVLTAWATLRAKAISIYPFDEGHGDPHEHLSGVALDLAAASSVTWVAPGGLVGLDFPQGTDTAFLKDESTGITTIQSAAQPCTFFMVFQKTVAPGPAFPDNAHRAYVERRTNDPGDPGSDDMEVWFRNGKWDGSEVGVQKVCFMFYADNADQGGDGNSFIEPKIYGNLPANAYDGKPHVLICRRETLTTGTIWFDGVDISAGAVFDSAESFTPAVGPWAFLAFSYGTLAPCFQGKIFRAGMFGEAITDAEVQMLSALPFGLAKPGPGTLEMFALQTALDSEETDRIAGDATLQAEIDALPTSAGGAGTFVGSGVPDSSLGIQGSVYHDRETGKVYRKWSKPLDWSWSAAGAEQADLAALVGLLAAALEGSGATVKELVTGSPMTLPGAVSWATREGIPVLRFDGTGGIVCPGPVIGQSTAWTVMAIVQTDGLPGDRVTYAETSAGGDSDAYNTALGIESTAAAIYTDSYATATDPDELGGSTFQHPESLARLAVCLIRRNGATLTFQIDGRRFASYFHQGDSNIVLPPMANGSIGVESSDGVAFDVGPFTGDKAGVIVWPTTALSDAAMDEVAANPFGTAREAGADLTLEPGMWVKVADLATQAEIDALPTGATSLDGLSDVTLTSPLNGQVLIQRASVFVNDAIAESDVTNLVTDLAGKQPLATNLTAIAALVGASDRLAYFTGVGTLSLVTFTAFGRTLAALADAAAGRTALAVVPGTDVQAFHANLSALAGLTLIADRLPYANGSGTLALTTLSAFIRTLLDDADAATAIATLGAVATGDSRLSDSRAPNGSAAGSLSGTYPNPGVAKLNETSGPTALTIGAIADGEFTKRSGTTLIGGTPSSTPADGSITDAKLADMPAATLKGRALGAGTGVASNLTASQIRTLAALVIGTDVQAWAAKLDALAALTWAADKGLYFTSASAAATFDLSSFIRTLLDDADAATARTTLGLAALAVLATVGTTQIDNDAVTNAKLANVATATFKGRATAGTGDPEDLTIAQAKAVLALEYWKSGEYYSAPCESVSNVSYGEGEARFEQFYAPVSRTADRIAVDVNVLGSAGSVLRLVIYYDSDGDGIPDTLLLDAGTVVTTATGIKEITINQAFVGGTNYWLSAIAQGAAVTRPTMRALGANTSPFRNTSLTTGATAVFISPCFNVASGITGAAPGSITPTYSANPPRVFLRAA